MKTIVEIKSGKIVEDNAYLTFCELNEGKALWLADESELETKRSKPQNNALHLFCSQLSDRLNEMGLGMREIMKPTYYFEWTMENVKNNLWRFFQIKITGKESTKDLSKVNGEIEKIHETLMRELGEKHKVEFIKFPSKCSKCKHLECVCGLEEGEKDKDNRIKINNY